MSHRAGSLVGLAALVFLWVLLLGQSFEASWRFTESVVPAESVWRYEPLREGLRGIRSADLYAGFERRSAQHLVFWRAQLALAPTVLDPLYEVDRILERARRREPHAVVVEFPTHEQFVRFKGLYEETVAGSGRVIRIQDLGDGVGLIVSGRQCG